jgi:hypothetical protein
MLVRLKHCVSSLAQINELLEKVSQGWGVMAESLHDNKVKLVKLFFFYILVEFCD